MAITPYLLYRDAGAAVVWLGKAFGLRKSGSAYKDQQGRVTHASLRLGEALVMLGSPGPDFKGPKAVGHVTQNLYVDVPAVDRHYARAVKAGATIIEPLTNTFYGDRRYGADDPEGHRWYFAQTLATKKPARKKIAPRSRARAASGSRKRR